MEKVSIINNIEQEPSDLVKKILTIGDEAGLILMKHLNNIKNVDYKKDEYDPVTEADRESDDFIRGKLIESFPDDKILSEENENVPEDYDGRVWMVDPLDETKGFLKGKDSFAINIGLLEDGKPVFGCVLLPARGDYLYAEKGKGAFGKINGKFQKLTVDSIADIYQVRIIVREPTKEIRPIEAYMDRLPVAGRVIGGSAGDKVSLMVTGQAEAHVMTNTKASKWDTCAPQIILEEAGGIMTDMDGNPLNYLQKQSNWERLFVMSNNETVHALILESLKGLEI